MNAPDLTSRLSFGSLEAFEKWRTEQQDKFSAITRNDRFGRPAMQESDRRMAALRQKLQITPPDQTVKVDWQEIGLHDKSKSGIEALQWLEIDADLAAAIAFYAMQGRSVSLNHPEPPLEAYVLSCLGRHAASVLQWQTILDKLRAFENSYAAESKRADDNWERLKESQAAHEKTIAELGKTVDALRESVKQADAKLDQRVTTLSSTIDGKTAQASNESSKLLAQLRQEHETALNAIAQSTEGFGKALDGMREQQAAFTGGAIEKIDAMAQERYEYVGKHIQADANNAIRALQQTAATLAANQASKAPIVYWSL